MHLLPLTIDTDHTFQTIYLINDWFSYCGTPQPTHYTQRRMSNTFRFDVSQFSLFSHDSVQTAAESLFLGQLSSLHYEFQLTFPANVFRIIRISYFSSKIAMGRQKKKKLPNQENLLCDALHKVLPAYWMCWKKEKKQKQNEEKKCALYTIHSQLNIEHWTSVYYRY